MSKFRKKPVVIEASRFLVADEPWPRGVRCVPMQELGQGDRTVPGYVIYDFVQNCDVRVNPGDWIITGVKGERYPCDPDVFEATYDSVQEDAVSDQTAGSSSTIRD